MNKQKRLVAKIFALRGEGHSIRAIAGQVDVSHTVVHRILLRTARKAVNVPESDVEKAGQVNRFYLSRYRMRMDDTRIGRMIRMHQQGKTQNEIAEELNVTQSCISKWLKRLREKT